MNGWRIDIDGVRGVLASVAREGEALSAHERDATQLADEAASACAPSTRVGGAIAGLLAAHGDEVAVAATRSRRVLDAATEATRAYLAADEVMAARAEQAAVDAFGEG